MATTRVNLDVTQYVRVTSDPLIPSSLLLQSHRDTVRVAFSTVKPAKSNDVFHELGGEHPPFTVPMTEVACWALAMTERSALTVTEQRVPVEVSDRGDMGTAVYIQDQTTPILDIKFLNRLGSFQLAINTTADTRFFTAVTGHNIVIDNVIELGGARGFVQAQVIGVVGDVIEIDSLIGDIYETGINFNRSISDMRVDGSTTPVIFSIKPDPGQSGDINLVKWAIQNGTSMDFSKFGSASPLTVGCLLRYKRADGTFSNLFNWKSNGGIILRGFDHYFQDKVEDFHHSSVK
tara:strand:+ start:23330 stop:24202 length:873 start_codon:yes stop_codon:yes gene_type:complete